MKRTRMKKPPHPGEGVQVDCLEPYNLSITDGAKILGITRQTLSMLVNKKTALSWNMAIRLSKAFGGTPDGWMGLQFQYDAAHVSERAKQIKVKPYKGVLEPIYQ
ncbi:MAG: HigA family addiction module antitoxin [Candidatus Anammoxibacter sp.]